MLRRRLRAALPPAVVRAYDALRRAREVRRWEASGRPAPPPHAYKVRVVLEHGRRFGLSTLVETGTYLGDMVEACRRRFARVISIEIDERLSAGARARFRGDARVSILQGDSAEVLPRALAEVPGPCLFWLDGHYSAGITGRGALETPVLAELAHIAARGRADVILIDDARCFIGEGDYPRLEEVRTLAASRWPAHRFEVTDDIVRITPRDGRGDARAERR